MKISTVTYSSMTPNSSMYQETPSPGPQVSANMSDQRCFLMLTRSPSMRLRSWTSLMTLVTLIQASTIEIASVRASPEKLDALWSGESHWEKIWYTHFWPYYKLEDALTTFEMSLKSECTPAVALLFAFQHLCRWFWTWAFQMDQSSESKYESMHWLYDV